MLAMGWLMISSLSSACAAACSCPMPPSIRIRLGMRLVFFEDALVAPLDRLAHAGEIVAQQAGGLFRAFRHGLAANDELAVVGFFHPPVFPHHHGRDRVRPLNVRNVEALDALGRLGQPQRGFERLGDGLRAGLAARGNAA